MKDNININCYENMQICVPETSLPRVVVIGGGFAGLSFIKRLKNKPVQLILIDKGNHHQFLPLLYQVATSGIEPDNIVFPFRKLFRNYKNIIFRMAEVRKVDATMNRVETDIGIVEYDFLVIATGSVTNFFGNREIAQKGLGLKSVPDALNIRSHLLQNLERAAISCNTEDKESLSSVVVVGGGPAGVEMAGALAEFKKYVLPKDYPELKNTKMDVYLIQATGRLLGDLPEKLSLKTEKYLRKMEVKVLLNIAVESYGGDLVKLSNGDSVRASALIWTAGIKGTHPDGFDQKTINRQGRLFVSELSRVNGYDNIFAIGDIAVMKTDFYPNGHPMVAQSAIQQGKTLADNLMAELSGKPSHSFVYKDKGSLATIGKKKAVADIYNLNISGFAAWILWSVVHLMSIVGVRNKLLIGLNWMWSYLSYDKGDRVIIRKYEPVKTNNYGTRK